MPLTPNFSVSQTISAADFVITDTSTGSDSNISARRGYLQLDDGTYLKPSNSTTDYILFPLSNGASINIQGLLTKDYDISITLQWVDVNGNVLYAKTQSVPFSENDEQFDYFLTQGLVANPALLQDSNYVFNRLKLRMFIDASVNAVQYGNDIQAGQQCLDFAQIMINQQSNYF